MKISYKILPYSLFLFFLSFYSSCGSEQKVNQEDITFLTEKDIQNKYPELSKDKINIKMVNSGESLFNSNKCKTCHTNELMGPDLANVTKRRSNEWIMNMILYPAKMLKEDETAQQVRDGKFRKGDKKNVKFSADMEDMDLSERQAREILEYLRSNDLSE